MSLPVSFSTQRKAGMSWFEPSRMPAWLAPVCDERSVSHSTRRWLSSASQRAISGALPSRIARRSTGSDRPSISRKMMPGTVGLGRLARRARATRWTTRRVYVSSSLVPTITSRTIADRRRHQRREQRPAEVVDRDRFGDDRRRPAAASGVQHSTSMKVEADRVGQPQRRDRRGGSRAFRTAIRAAASSAPPKPSIATPGTIPAATSSASAEMTHETTRRSGWRRGRSGRQAGRSPWGVECGIRRPASPPPRARA